MVEATEHGVVIVHGGAEGFAQEIIAGRHRLIADEPTFEPRRHGRSRILENQGRIEFRRCWERAPRSRAAGSTPAGLSPAVTLQP